MVGKFGFYSDVTYFTPKMGVWVSMCISGQYRSMINSWPSILKAHGLSPGIQFEYSNENVLEYNSGLGIILLNSFLKAIILTLSYENYDS